MKLKFYKKLYLDENIENEDEIIDILEENNIIPNLYLVCISKNINHIFDIFSIKEVYKDRYKDKEYIVVGMSYGKKEAFILVKKIFEDNISNINRIKEKFIKNR